MFIQTHTGKKFEFANADPDTIHIVDIAHALSMICRFNGHVKEFYSVAQHCYLASYLCDKRIALAVLLHDAAEAYLGDMVSPLKMHVRGEYSRLERSIQNIINFKFCIGDIARANSDFIKRADLQMLKLEAKTLLTHPPVDNWTDRFNVPEQTMFSTIAPMCPRVAKFSFLTRFEELITR